MSRWLVIGLVAIVAVAVGGGISQLRQNIAQDRAGQAGSGSAAGTDDELVTRVISTPFSYTGKEQGVVLVRGALPPDPKVDAPMPTGSRLIGSVLRTSGGTPSGIQILLDVPGSASDIAAFYDREFTALGWKPQPDRGPAPGGFQMSSPALGKGYCKGETPPWLSLTVFTKDKGPADVRLQYQLLNEGMGSGGPCSAQSFGPQPFPNKIPPLRAPSDVRFTGGTGSGGSGDRQTSETNAVSSRGAADLESHFAGQLAAAGWSRVAGSANGPIAWSQWKLPDGDWTGVLFVLETGSEKRLLSVRAESSAAR
jgi:hypothetical protein